MTYDVISDMIYDMIYNMIYDMMIYDVIYDMIYDTGCLKKRMNRILAFFHGLLRM